MPRALKAHEQVADHYRQEIRNGRPPPGGDLDSIRVIAGKWGIAPNTAYKALRLLRDEGWIQLAQGRRPTVVGIPGRRK